MNDPGGNPRELSWNAVESAASYKLWINNLSTGESAIVRATDLQKPNYELENRHAIGRFRAWVQASNQQGQSAWSAPVDYVVGPYATIPDTSEVTGPNTAASNRPATFTWTRAARATAYELWVRNLSTGEDAVIHRTDLTANILTPSGPLPAGRYRAWIRARNGAGVATWSAAHTFRVIDVTSPPDAPSFRNGEERSGQIQWEAVPSADSYEIWANNLTTGDSRALHQTDLKDTVFRPDPATPQDKYRVWVRAKNGTGNGAWSAPVDIIFFSLARTRPEVPRFTQSSVTDSAGHVALTWEDGHIDGEQDYANYYEIWINNAETGERVLHERNVTQNNLTTPQPLADGEYTIWLRASNAYGKSAWSRGHSFVVRRPTQLPPPPVEIQSLSFSGGTRVLHLEWNRVAEADSYEVQFFWWGYSKIYTTEDPQQSSGAFLGVGAIDVDGRDYVLRMRAVNRVGVGEWSEFMEFTSEWLFVGYDRPFG